MISSKGLLLGRPNSDATTSRTSRTTSASSSDPFEAWRSAQYRPISEAIWRECMKQVSAPESPHSQSARSEGRTGEDVLDRQPQRWLSCYAIESRYRNCDRHSVHSSWSSDPPVVAAVFYVICRLGMSILQLKGSGMREGTYLATTLEFLAELTRFCKGVKSKSLRSCPSIVGSE